MPSVFKPLRVSICIILFFIPAVIFAQNRLVPLWKYAAGGELVSPPAVSDHGVYLYSEDRQVHAVTAGGKALWTFKLSGRPDDVLSVGRDGTIYAGTYEGRLYAINRGGTQIWRFDAGGRLSGAPAVSSEGTIYFGTEKGTLSALSHRGFVRWSVETGAGISGSPVIDTGEAIYICTAGGEIRSYTPWGTELWNLPVEGLSGETSWSAAIDEHILYSAGGRMLSAIDYSAGILWQAELPAVCSGVVVFSDGLFCTLADGSAVAVSIDGEILWKTDKGGFSSYPVAGNKSLFLISRGNLVSMNDEGGINGLGRVDGIELTQPVIGSGLLVCGSRQWVACAFNISEDLGSGWSQEGGSPGHTGAYGDGSWYFNESEYLKNMDYLYLRDSIVNGDQQQKLDAVNEIGERISADGTDRGEKYLLHLLHIALTEGNRRISLNTAGPANDYPAVRRRAAALIGRYGNFQSVELLCAVLADERHYDVSAAIIRALGELGTDYNNLSQWTIYNKVNYDNNRSAYDLVALAAIDAIAGITEYTGSQGSGYGFRTLMTIYRGNYSAGTRRRAGEVLRSIR